MGRGKREKSGEGKTGWRGAGMGEEWRGRMRRLRAGWEGRGRRCRELPGGFAVPRSAADQLLSVGCGMWDSYW